MWMRLRTMFFAAALLLLSPMAPVKAQQKAEIKITRQPSIIYMPSYVMEARHLIESRAAALGVTGLKVNWISFAGGGNATDALLAGSVEVVNTGVGNMLLLWDRTRGGVKGIVATSAQPLTLITRNPNIKTLRDFTPRDRIALPTVRVSTQAILLQIASEKVFGPGQGSRLDANTVQLGHPDAAAAMMNPQHEITSHFTAPPYTFQELRDVPGARVVTDSQDVMGTPLTVALMFTTTRFAEANPKLVQAVKEASAEALQFIRTDTRGAVEIYRAASKDPTPVDDLMAMLKQPGMMDFETRPQGTMRFAEHMHKTGLLKTMPAAWTDYFLSIAHDLGGG